MKIYFLVSDICILLLFVGGIFWFFRAKKNTTWQKAFQKISQNRSAMISLFVLCIYISISILDSIRLESKDPEKTYQINSLLDLILIEIKENSEKTYSAPFSISSYSKENIQADDATSIRDYPRLKHAGQHLKNIEDHAGDIALRVLSSIVIFVLLSGGLFWGYIFYRKKKEKAYMLKEVFSSVWRSKSWFIIPSAVLLLISILIVNFYGKYHIMGTDKAGFDVFYISIKSIRTGVLIGVLTTIVVTPIAILAGILAGFLGGFIDDLIQYIYTTLESIPSILLIAAAMLIVETLTETQSALERGDQKLIYLCMIMGITSWTNLCRLIRGETLKIRELEYVEAAKAFGVGRTRIMLYHILPNIVHIVFIVIVLRFSGLVLSEAVLTYIGIGVDPSIQSWGNMINQARFELAREPLVWWNLISAFFFMFTLVLPANIIADAVRDALDPKMLTHGRDK